MNGIRRWVGLSLLCLSCATASGKYPPASVQPGTYPWCGTSGLALAADVILATLGGAIIGLAAADGVVGPGVVGAALTVGFGASALNGVVIRESCAEAQRAAERHFALAPLRVPLPPSAPASTTHPDAGAPDGRPD
jgi:hypothetical protein